MQKAKNILIFLVILTAMIFITSIPFSTQVVPEVNFILLDNNDDPIGNIKGSFSFIQSPISKDIFREFKITEKGQISFPSQKITLNLINRIKNQIVFKGSKVDKAYFNFIIPSYYDFSGDLNDLEKDTHTKTHGGETLIFFDNDGHIYVKGIDTSFLDYYSLSIGISDTIDDYEICFTLYFELKK